MIVGASLAGLRAAQAARADGFTGELVLIGDETHLPYDRPPLSKDFILGVEEPVTPYFDGATTLADELDIRLMLGAPADSLDSASRLVTVGDVAVDYDAILLATGRLRVDCRAVSICKEWKRCERLTMRCASAALCGPGVAR